jgi:bisphosphoglycerate-independent phosphoglycerate mutase (AlkP superfamily)
MVNPKTGEVHTAHTNNPVPLIFVSGRAATIAKPEKVINLVEVNQALAKTESDIKKFTDEHNAYLKELGVDLLNPVTDKP